MHELAGHAQLGRQGLGEAPGIFSGVVGGDAFIGKKGRVVPHRLAIGAPINVQRPARQLLAGVPLALAKMQKTTLPVFLAQLVHQLGGIAAFGGAQGVNVPFGCVAVVHRHKGGLATHGQAHIAQQEFCVHGGAEFHHCGPLLFGVGLGDAGRLIHAGHLHLVLELHLALVHAAFNGGCARGLWCAGQGDVAFARQQA